MVRFEKKYHWYDLKKAEHKGYMKGAIISFIIIVISFTLGRLF